MNVQKVPFRVPENACDCHMHVFGPMDRYPLAPMRAYTPPQATHEDYIALAEPLGLRRFVVVQPSAYGTDNQCLLDTLDACRDRARGIVVVDPSTISDPDIAAMHERGVRGIRVNLVSSSTALTSDVVASIRLLADRVAPFGWHLQFFVGLAQIVEIAPELSTISVPVVFDHMGNARAELGTDQPGFATLVDLVASGQCWVKVSGAYHISNDPRYADTAPIARALIEANPARIVWGSDWPHIGKTNRRLEPNPGIVPYRKIDDTGLLSLVGDWTDSDDVRQQILVENPRVLYHF